MLMKPGLNVYCTRDTKRKIIVYISYEVQNVARQENGDAIVLSNYGER